MTTNVLTASVPTIRRISISNRGWVGSAALLGGGMIAGGTLLPWVSFFAGLHPVHGVAGLNGRLLLAAGLVIMLAGVAFLIWGGDQLRRGIGWAGVLLSGISLVLLLRLFQTLEQLAASPMMVPQLGPGLFVTTVGAAVVAAVFIAPRFARRAWAQERE